jgi:hypothetical protein
MDRAQLAPKSVRIEGNSAGLSTLEPPRLTVTNQQQREQTAADHQQHHADYHVHATQRPRPGSDVKDHPVFQHRI